MANLNGPTGSLHNNIATHARQIEPAVGMGATELCWTDRHAYTIVEIKSPATIVVQRDIAKRTDANGMSDAQSYDYTPDPNGGRVVVTKRRNGRWVTKGHGMKNGTAWLIGERDEHYDYSF